MFSGVLRLFGRAVSYDKTITPPQAAPHRARVYTRKFFYTAGKYAAAACGIFLFNAFLAFGAGAGEMRLADAQHYAALSECLWPLCHFWLTVLLCLDARQLRYDDFQAA